MLRSVVGNNAWIVGFGLFRSVSEGTGSARARCCVATEFRGDRLMIRLLKTSQAQALSYDSTTHVASCIIVHYSLPAYHYYYTVPTWVLKSSGTSSSLRLEKNSKIGYR